MSLDQEVMRARARYSQAIQLVVFPSNAASDLIDTIDHAMADVIEATQRDTLATVLRTLADQLSAGGAANTMLFDPSGDVYVNGRRV